MNLLNSTSLFLAISQVPYTSDLVYIHLNLYYYSEYRFVCHDCKQALFNSNSRTFNLALEIFVKKVSDCQDYESTEQLHV